MLVFEDAMPKILQDALRTRAYTGEALTIANICKSTRQGLFETEPIIFTGHFPPYRNESVSNNLKKLFSMILNGSNITKVDYRITSLLDNLSTDSFSTLP